MSAPLRPIEYDVPIGSYLEIRTVLLAIHNHFIDQVMNRHGVVGGMRVHVVAKAPFHPRIRAVIDEVFAAGHASPLFARHQARFEVANLGLSGFTVGLGNVPPSTPPADS